MSPPARLEGAGAGPRWWGIAAFLLSLAGLGDALYLTIDHYTGKLLPCSASGFVDCTKVTTSAESSVLHVPVALLGALFYFGLVIVNSPPAWRLGWRPLLLARLSMLVVGIAFVVYLVAVELFVVDALCLWCTGVHLVTFALFALVVVSYPTLSAGVAAIEQGTAGGEDVSRGSRAAPRAPGRASARPRTPGPRRPAARSRSG